MGMTITSTAFGNNEPIPSFHTCDGSDISPPLQWTGIPPDARSLVLIVDDPDAPDPAAPQRTWVHWVLYNLPPDSSGIAQGAGTHALPAGTKTGINDWRRTGYGGPCPPIGTHRYFHKLYALDTVLPDLHGPTKQQLEQAMQGHVIEKAELVGKYRRSK